MDKIEGRSCSKMVAKSDNWILMQTVREKLKGHLMNGLVTKTFKPIVEKVLVDIKELLAKYPMKKQRNKRESATKSVLKESFSESSGNPTSLNSEPSLKFVKEELEDELQKVAEPIALIAEHIDTDIVSNID